MTNDDFESAESSGREIADAFHAIGVAVDEVGDSIEQVCAALNKFDKQQRNARDEQT